MYEHVKELSVIASYSAPADAKVTPVTIPENHELIELLTGGKVFFEVNGETKCFERGTVFWHNAGEQTIFRTIPEAPYRCIVFRFVVSSQNRPCERVSVWKSPDAAAEFAVECLKIFHAGVADKAAFSAYVYSTLAWNAVSHSINTQSDYPKQLQQALDYIGKNYASNITAEDIASAAGVSRPYLFSLFKKHFSESPYQHILQQRMAKAKVLLAGGTIPIKEIAMTCGFDSIEVFYRQFRHFAKIPPAEYRKQYSPYAKR